MGDTRQVVDGQDTAPDRQLHQTTPGPDGPPTIATVRDPAAVRSTSGTAAAPPTAANADPADTHPADADADPADADPADDPSTAAAVRRAGPDSGATSIAAAAVDPGPGHRWLRLRLPSPRRAARRTTHALAAWSRRPSGRLTLPALLLLTLVTATGAAGAVLVPATAPVPTPSTAAADGGPDLAPSTPAGANPPPTPGSGAPVATPTTAPGSQPGRPADALARWARQIGDRVGVPPVAMQAYGYAELVLAQTKPGCRLSWTTLAAIGLVESNHGQANNATLHPDGQARPPIIGPPLDGTGGRQRIADTDAGQIDGDRSVDRAVGPMQFIPTTWRQSGIDADNDGAKNPNDIDDAALAAGMYLCGSGRDLSTAADWWAAVLSYNDVRSYAQAVFDAANQYGTASRT